MIVFYFGYYNRNVNFRIELLYENAVKINTAIQDSQNTVIDLTKLLVTTLESDIDESIRTLLINEYIENSDMVVGIYQIDKSGKIFSAYPYEKTLLVLII